MATTGQGFDSNTLQGISLPPPPQGSWLNIPSQKWDASNMMFVHDILLPEDFVPQNNDGEVSAYGPAKPSVTGKTGMVETDATVVTTDITKYGSTASIGNKNGIKVFAGPRDDPFFFDLVVYKDIIAGNASGFNNPGADTFAGTNVMSVVIEVPKSMLGSAASLNTWAVTKRKV